MNLQITDTNPTYCAHCRKNLRFTSKRLLVTENERTYCGEACLELARVSEEKFRWALERSRRVRKTA